MSILRQQFFYIEKFKNFVKFFVMFFYLKNAAQARQVYWPKCAPSLSSPQITQTYGEPGFGNWVVIYIENTKYLKFNGII